MSRDITPEGWPEIYFTPKGDYEEKVSYIKEKYNVDVVEGESTENLVNEIKDKGFDIPNKETITICDCLYKDSLLKELYKIIEDNEHCETCVKNALDYINEIGKCEVLRDAELL